jgi:hypothetical protein
MLRAVLSRIWGFCPRRLDRELDEEIQGHRDMRSASSVKAWGLPTPFARRGGSSEG